MPKTKAGIRTIPLGEAVIVALRNWRKLTRFSNADDLVFPNYLGTYWDHDGMVKSKWKPLFKRLADRWEEERRNEQLAYFNWHALRHFAISCWIDAGLPPKTVQTFAGHASLQITMDRYGHLFRSERHNEAMDAIAEGIKSDRPSERFKNQNRKWSDFGPK
ncbi:MAG: tyrosine-type recombinase/integrase [Proteobacteria bacterium]|nr:tyrosine-type recombinase/integrase [Pseudomonadota bacterium]